MDTTQTVVLYSLLFMLLETLLCFCPADPFDFKSLTRFRMRQIIWMRQPESGFTQTGVSSGQGKTCTDMSAHNSCVHNTQKINHAPRQKPYTVITNPQHKLCIITCKHMCSQRLYWPRPGEVEKGWSYLCGHWQGHFPDWSPHMTSQITDKSVNQIPVGHQRLRPH